MASKTIQQAEQDVLAAARAFGIANARYCVAYERNGDAGHAEGVPLHPETDAFCHASALKSIAMAAAAKSLYDADVAAAIPDAAREG